MWIMTTFGFFSVVQKSGTKNLTIRARVGSDLDRLRDRYLPGLSPTKMTPSNDYRYRATASHEEVASAMSKIVADVTYSNFKSEVERTQGHPREMVYAEVWSVLDRGLPPLDETGTDAITPAKKYGGVVFDDAGRVLLREPKHHFDNYVWTFAKGAPDQHETPQQAALREVREETGVEAQIAGVIPGAFAGGTGTTAYYLMKRIAEHPLSTSGKRETEQIRWATEAEAKKLIAQTTNEIGRKRDLDVLAAAFAAWRTRGR